MTGTTNTSENRQAAFNEGKAHFLAGRKKVARVSFVAVECWYAYCDGYALAKDERARQSKKKAAA